MFIKPTATINKEVKEEQNQHFVDMKMWKMFSALERAHKVFTVTTEPTILRVHSQTVKPFVGIYVEQVKDHCDDSDEELEDESEEEPEDNPVKKEKLREVITRIKLSNDVWAKNSAGSSKEDI